MASCPNPQSPIIPGHEIVGRIDAIGTDVAGARARRARRDPWLGHTCGVCRYCLMQRENLCDRPLFTGYTRDGGFATTTIADARFAFPLGEARRRRRARAAAVCRIDRLALAGHRRRGAEARAVRFRRRRAHLRAGRQMAGTIGIRLHPSGRHGHASVRLGASARPGPADRTKCRPSRSMRRSYLRPSAVWFRWRCRPCARAAAWFAPAST